MFSKPFFTAAVLAALSSVVSAQCTGRTSQVQPGDTCDLICQRDQVSNFQLLLFNPMINPTCSNLIPGQTLCLSMEGVDCTDLYQISDTDDQGCFGIAQAHGVDLNVFLANNGNPDCTTLRPGQVVCVATTQIPY